jgi:hypothetical protein
MPVPFVPCKQWACRTFGFPVGAKSRQAVIAVRDIPVAEDVTMRREMK